MQFHQMKATLKKEVSCPLCQKILSSEISLLSHTRFVHERSERYQCKTCEKLLSSSLALKGHNLRHENFHNFICVVCDKKFSQKVHLKSHMLLHSGTKPHKCPFCDNTYVDKSRMQDHIHNIHEEAKLDNFKCDNCQKLFKYRIAPSHKIVCETLDYSDTQIVCRLCGEKLTSISVKDHWKLHSNKIQHFRPMTDMTDWYWNMTDIWLIHQMLMLMLIILTRITTTRIIITITITIIISITTAIIIIYRSNHHYNHLEQDDDEFASEQKFWFPSFSTLASSTFNKESSSSQILYISS